jgi:hypothetical protein
MDLRLEALSEALSDLSTKEQKSAKILSWLKEAEARAPRVTSDLQSNGGNASSAFTPLADVDIERCAHNATGAARTESVVSIWPPEGAKPRDGEDSMCLHGTNHWPQLLQGWYCDV